MIPELPPIGNMALLMSFIHIKVGNEFEVAKDLSKRFNSSNPLPIYLTVYGNCDLMELVMVDSLSSRHHVPVNESIVESSTLLFYCWEGLSHPINDWLLEKPVAIVTLLNCDPALVVKESFKIEIGAIQTLQKRLGDHTNFFAGMGHSEILMLLRGNDLNALCEQVSHTVRNLTLADLKQEGFYNGSSELDRPIFICTTSFPTVNHPHLHMNRSFEGLVGEIEPQIHIDCRPGLEDRIAKFRPPGTTIRNIYGKYDIVVNWPGPVKMTRFAEEQTAFRQQIGGENGVRSTCTYFKSSRTSENNIDCDSLTIESEPDTQWSRIRSQIIEKSHILEDMERGKLLDFLNRLNSYLSRKETNWYFRDMKPIVAHILAELTILADPALEPGEALGRKAYVSRILDIANHAAYQRYSGIDTHFDFHTGVPYPFLCDINGYVSAAESIPSFLYTAYFGEKDEENPWPGFVLFGQSYSPQFLPGHTLSLPAMALLHPIRDWWSLTHEIGHSFYHLLGFWEKIPKNDFGKRLRKKTDETRKILMVDIEEIFVHWFDYQYVFGGRAELYFPMIWWSWLRWQRPRTYPSQYIIRSFAAYMTGHLKELVEAQKEGLDETLNVLRNKLEEMNKLITEKVPDYKILLDRVDEWDGIIKVIVQLSDLLVYLQKQWFNKDFHNKINEVYPTALLDRHVESIEKGKVISEPIPNPIKLLHRLHERYEIGAPTVPIKATGAIVLSLWNNYASRTLSRS